MNKYVCIVLLTIASTQAWPFDNLLENAFISSYEEAKRMQNSMIDFFDVQTVKDNNQINSVKTGKTIADAWFYLPTEEPGAQMDNPDTVLSVPAIITRNGYTCETHTIMSQGYLISMHRIPRPKRGDKISEKTVLLQHGLLTSSADWILNGPDKSLAYVLADAGYDVWMPNIRGNKYPNEHERLKSGSKSFWNFSWHDIALHDIPSVIDYIIKVKGKTDIAYIGHSMGTTILFAMLSLRPEYNDILKAGIALAPAVFFSNINSPLKNLAPMASNMAYMDMLYGAHEFIPKQSFLGRILNACDMKSIDGLNRKNVIFYICSYNEKQFNQTLLPVFLSNLKAGTSWKTIVHFAQEVLSGGRFQQFDYGSNNMRVYNSETPPEYDLSKISLPITLLWAENDLLSSKEDVQMLYRKLPPTTEVYKIQDPQFNHIDFLWGKDAPTLVNAKVLETLQKAFKSNYVRLTLRFK